MSRLARLILFKSNNVLHRNYNKIVMSADGSTVVALHKDQDFPYEHSRPLPEEIKEDNSVLKMNDLNEIQRVFYNVHPEIARKELCSLTLTTKHRWFPRARDKKAKKDQPMNRPYL